MIQFIHRWAAIAVALYAVAMLAMAIKVVLSDDGVGRLGGLWFCRYQVILGIATLLNYVPLGLALVPK